MRTTDEQSTVWSELDLFDMISPEHDHSATARSMRRSCAEVGLDDVDIEVVSKGWQLAVRARAS